VPKRLTIESIVGKYPDLVPGQVYANNTTKLWWRCLAGLDHENYQQTYRDHQSGSGCARCGRKKIASALRLTVSTIEERFPGELVPNQVYINSQAKLTWVCTAGRGHENYSRSLNGRRRGGGCPLCGFIQIAEKKHYTIEELREIHPDDLVSGQPYKDAHAKMLWRCLANRGHENYWQNLGNHKRHHGCLRCLESTCEKRIAAVFGAIVEREKVFKSCRDKRPLRFDFKITDKNILIEFNGLAHYKAVRFGGICKREAAKKLVTQKRRDSIKKSWALSNGFLLICVPYYVDDVEGHILQRMAARFPDYCYYANRTTRLRNAVE
jgi:hypothetical protein